MFFLKKIELTYSLTVAPSDTLGFVFIGKGRKSCGSKKDRGERINENDHPLRQWTILKP